LQHLHHRLLSSMHLLCVVMCAGKHNRMSINLEQRIFLRMNKKYLADVLL